MRLLFWFAAGLILYAYIGYPIWLWVRSRLRPKPVRRGSVSDSISVVMVVRDGASVLAALDEGSARQPALEELANRLRRQRTTMARWVVGNLTSRSALVSDLTPEEAVETVLVLIDPLLQRRLLVERGWTVERLATWLGRSMRRLLLPPEP